MRFSATALLLIATSLITAQNCPRVCVRREVRSLSSDEMNRYFSAVRQLMTSGRWDRRTASHINVQNYAHGTSLFLVWHRAFIREVEKDLQSIDGSLCLHYWSWDIDSQAPEVSPVLGSSYYGPLADGCISNRMTGNWTASNPSRHCVSRDFDTGSSYNSPEDLNAIISSSNSYESFNQRIQVPHGVVHTSFGGDMLTMASANDPVFYAHHAFVDLLYYRWQRAYPNLAETFSGDSSITMQELSYRVRDVFDIESLCYSYASFTEARVRSQKIIYEAIKANVTSPGGTLPDNQGRNNTAPTGGVLPTDISRGPAPTPTPAPAPAPASGGVAPASGAAPGQVTFTMPALPAPVQTPPENPPKSISGGVLPEVVVRPPTNSTPPGDRKELVKLRTPKPLPESWCVMNNLKVADVRTIETECRSVHDKFNKMYGYVSPASLYLRRDLCARVIYRNDHTGSKKKDCSITVDSVGTLDIQYKQTDPGKAFKEVCGTAKKALPDHYVAPEKMKARIKAIIGDSNVLDENSVSNVFKTSVDAASGSDSKEESGAAQEVTGSIVAIIVVIAATINAL